MILADFWIDWAPVIALGYAFGVVVLFAAGAIWLARADARLQRREPAQIIHLFDREDAS